MAPVGTKTVYTWLFLLAVMLSPYLGQILLPTLARGDVDHSLVHPGPQVSEQNHDSDLSRTSLGAPAQLEVLPGTEIYALPNLPNSLSARITDAAENPVPGVPVTFQVKVGSGNLGTMQAVTNEEGETITAVTNEEGEAITSMTLPTVLEPTCVVVSAAGLTLKTAKWTGVPEEALRLIEVSGNNQVASSGDTLKEPFVVRVEAQFDAPIDDVCTQSTDPSVNLVAQRQAEASHTSEVVPQQQQSVPVVGVRVTADIIQGNADFVPPSSPEDLDANFVLSKVYEPGRPKQESATETVTTADGKASFRIKVIDNVENIITRISAAGSSVEFFTFILSSPAAVATEPDGTLVAIDEDLRSVVRLDPISGAQTLISNDLVGEGPGFDYPQGIAVQKDGSILVMDLSYGTGLIWIDPVSGDRTLVPDFFRPDQPLETPRHVAFESNDTVVLLDTYLGAVVRVNLITGDYKVVSGCTEVDRSVFEYVCIGDIIGLGPPFLRLGGIDVEADGSLVIADAGRIMRVDSITGNRTVISDSRRGNGPSLNTVSGIAVDDDRSLVVISWPDRVLRVDPITGDRTIVSDANRGGGPLTEWPAGITLIPNGPLAVADKLLHGIVLVDPTSGDRHLISDSNSRGSGRRFFHPMDLAIETKETIVVVDYSGSSKIIRVDLLSGNRTVVSGGGQAGGVFLGGVDNIDVEANGQLLILQNTRGDFRLKVVRVNPITGDTLLVSGEGRGAGPPFLPEGGRLLAGGNIAVEATGHIIVADRGNQGRGALFRVNPVTGDRSIISDATRGETSSFVPRGIAIEDDGTLVVGDEASRAVVRVDPVTGERTIVSDATIGSGPLFGSHVSIDVEPVGSFVLVNLFSEAVYRIIPDSGNREIISGGPDKIGKGFPISRPESIAVSPNGDILIVDSELKAVIQVDSETGDRMIISR